MSIKEMAKEIIDRIPESKMYYVIEYLEGAAVPDHIPTEIVNKETLESFQEMERGEGYEFKGSTIDELFEEILGKC